MQLVKQLAWLEHADPAGLIPRVTRYPIRPFRLGRRRMIDGGRAWARAGYYSVRRASGGPAVVVQSRSMLEIDSGYTPLLIWSGWLPTDWAGSLFFPQSVTALTILTPPLRLAAAKRVFARFVFFRFFLFPPSLPPLFSLTFPHI